MGDYNNAHGGTRPQFIPMSSSFIATTEPTPLEARVAALEERLEKLEKAQGMAIWHVGQFVEVNLPPLRSRLGLRPGYVPAHIMAAIKHLSLGLTPPDSVVSDALAKATAAEE